MCTEHARGEQTCPPTLALLQLPPPEREQCSCTFLTSSTWKNARIAFPMCTFLLFLWWNWYDRGPWKLKLIDSKYVSSTSHPLHMRLCTESLRKQVLHAFHSPRTKIPPVNQVALCRTGRCSCQHPGQCPWTCNPQSKQSHYSLSSRQTERLRDLHLFKDIYGSSHCPLLTLNWTVFSATVNERERMLAVGVQSRTEL